MNARWLPFVLIILAWAPSVQAQTEALQAQLELLLRAQRAQGEATVGAGLDLVYFQPAGPALLRLQFQVGDQPLQKSWAAYVRSWFDYLDRDGNGKLDANEIKWAPKTQVFQQLARQAFFFPQPNSSLTLAELGKQADESITPADLIRHYQKGAGPIQFFGNNNQGNSLDQVNDGLIKNLDVDKDGKLSRTELENAWQVLNKLDLDDDEVVVAPEIAPAGQVFGGGGRLPLQPGAGGSFFALTPGAPRAPLAVLLLAKYDKEKNGRLGRKELSLNDAAFQRLDLNKDGELDVEELAHWPERTPDYTWDIRLNQSGLETTWSLKKNGAAIPAATVSLADVDVTLRPPAGPNPFLANNRGNFYTQQFRAADKNNVGHVDLADVQGPQFQFLKLTFPLLDRNGDGKVTAKELQTLVDLQGGAQTSQVTVSLAEQGRTLFQLLDANRDGRLGQRELRSAWQRVHKLDTDGDEAIAPSEVPKHVQILFGLGAQAFNFQQVSTFGGGMDPRNPGIPAGRGGPLWFRKMDVNGDGDVSLREFLGSREEFQRMDSSGDGLIDASEAEAYEKNRRGK